ncbi:MAG: hypothetical protein PF448_12310 [Bacteroidales bacterium]|jgi:hypothetical protein|nr:hypothetical protein [Bacteroidales bacterium]
MEINKLKSIFFPIWILLLAGLLLTSCNESKLSKTPIDNFLGIWELKGRPMFDGIQLEIRKESDGNLTARVIKMNDNKYVRMFVETNNVWVTEISRISNFEFRLIEKRLGSELFSIYDLSSTSEYKVVFIDENTIALGVNGTDPHDSKIKYVRIE